MTLIITTITIISIIIATTIDIIQPNSTIMPIAQSESQPLPIRALNTVLSDDDLGGYVDRHTIMIAMI